MPDQRPGPPLTLRDLMTDYNDGPTDAPRTLLNGLLRCHPISLDQLRPGDIQHDYSSQLDAFNTWEIISVDPWVYVQIDSDGIDLSRTPVTHHGPPQPGEHNVGRFWRASPASREYWELHGWRRICGGYGFQRRTEYDVRPFVRLYTLDARRAVSSNPSYQQASKSAWAKLAAFFGKGKS